MNNTSQSKIAMLHTIENLVLSNRKNKPSAPKNVAIETKIFIKISTTKNSL